MITSKIPSESEIDLNQVISEFIQYVNEDSPNLSTDPNVVRVKIIKPNEHDWHRKAPCS
jgi:hypothetical protein